ncbi:MAG: hypothetical protein ACFCVC_01950 [Acidimicrobiia bacterium]
MTIGGVVVEGHRVASGSNGDPRFPGGTIAMQLPHFLALGVDLRPFHPATINISVAPRTVRLAAADVTYRQVRWHPTEPAEDFSFAPCRLRVGGRVVDALIYWPHPETKPEHVQTPDILELLAPHIDGLAYGDPVTVETAAGTITIE